MACSRQQRRCRGRICVDTGQSAQSSPLTKFEADGARGHAHRPQEPGGARSPRPMMSHVSKLCGVTDCYDSSLFSPSRIFFTRPMHPRTPPCRSQGTRVAWEFFSINQFLRKACNIAVAHSNEKSCVTRAASPRAACATPAGTCRAFPSSQSRISSCLVIPPSTCSR